MLTQDMLYVVRDAISLRIASSALLQLPLFVICSSSIIALIRVTYCAFFGPISIIPGPRWSALSNLAHLKAMWCGQEVAVVDALHKKYGPLVRLAPDLVAIIGSAQTWKQIYGLGTKGRHSLDKDLVFYDRPFNNIRGPVTADDQTASRQQKVLSPAISEQALKKYEHRLKSWASRLKDKLRQKAREGDSSDMVKMLNCMSTLNG